MKIKLFFKNLIEKVDESYDKWILSDSTCTCPTRDCVNYLKFFRKYLRTGPLNFCCECGAKMLDSVACPQCKNEISHKGEYCGNCGKNLAYK